MSNWIGFRTFGIASVVLLMCGLIAIPGYQTHSSHEGQTSGHLDSAAVDSHDDHGDTHDDPARHAGFDCHHSYLHCAPTSLVLPRGVQPLKYRLSLALALKPADDVLRSVYLERDPPIPRFSA